MITLGSTFGFQSSSSGGGGGGNLNYVHTQSIPASIWYVEHNLNAKCSIEVVDDNQVEIIADVKWIDNNNVEVRFNVETTGYVYCNK